MLGEPSPPFSGSEGVTAICGLERDRFEQPSEDARQPIPNRFSPEIEPGGLAEMEAVEEWTSIQARRVFRICARAHLKVGDVTPHNLRIENQVVLDAHDRIVSHQATE